MPMMKEIWTPLKLVSVRYFKDKDQNVYYKKVGKRHRVQTRPFWIYKRFYAFSMVLLLTIPGYFGYQFAMDFASDKIIAEVSKDVSDDDMKQILQDDGMQDVLKQELGEDKAAEVLARYKVDASSNAVPQTDTNSNTDASSSKASQSSEASSPSEGNKSSTPATDSSADKEEPVKETPKQPEKKPAKKPSTGFSNKDEATRFVMSKFSAGEINEFRSLAQGGLTGEEKSYIKSKVYSRLSAAEIEALKRIAVVEMSKQ
ncbi:hypothetical protein [Metabacillus iocasae]|uniref:Uncharacterized protein n=1 Tax=Priestia iocasae TaxID=2291674 RepID=A0ABS2QSA0_9BACI|nr:hypothetical protein [Metabacillus iocasae]MBM7702290.1 hypothetical protein [Metabacillus iocasae]